VSREALANVVTDWLLPQLHGTRPFVLGLCGAQGSGKSTLAAAVADRIEATAILSLDDLYRAKAERQTLARTVHPLLATRGVPGTHEVALGLATLDALDRGEAAPLPRFDKARDDRAPLDQWGRFRASPRLLIFEGWCVGARPEPEEALAEPIDALEREEDTDRVWRRATNAAFAGDYQRLFARIDRLMLLEAPRFDVVRDWRIEQEHDLRANAVPGATGLMSDAQVARFIQHYERPTRHILAEMPSRPDAVARLAVDRSLLSFRGA
jgi:D-glycerate 3-kinase